MEKALLLYCGRRNMKLSSLFEKLGSVGATLGLGFLAQLEGLFINKLLPIFAVIALYIDSRFMDFT